MVFSPLASAALTLFRSFEPVQRAASLPLLSLSVVAAGTVTMPLRQLKPTPGKGVAVAYSRFHHLHKLVQGQVVAFGPAPVVLNLEDELAVEGVVRIAGERDVVVGVEAQVRHEALRRVGLAFVGEGGGQFAEVVGVDIAQVLAPCGVDGLVRRLGDGAYVGTGDGVELVEVVERVAIERALHRALGHEAIVLHAVDDVVERAALREAYVAVGADGAVGAVHVGVIDQERLFQVKLALAHAEQFALDEGQRGVGPAGTAAVLVLDAGDGVGFYHGEDGLSRLVRFLLCCCHGGDGHEGSSEDSKSVHWSK